MCAGIFSNLVFFLVSVSSCPTEVHLLFSFVSFSAAYFCLLLILSFFMPMVSHICKLSLSPLSHLPVCELSSSTTFSHSALLSPLLDVSLCCGISQDLSLWDLVPLWDPPWRLPLLPLWNPCHPSTLFSLSVSSLTGFFSALSASPSLIQAAVLPCSGFWCSSVSICKSYQ